MRSDADIDRDLARDLEACAPAARLDGEISAGDLAALRAGLDARIAADRGLIARLRARPTPERVALVVTVTALTVAATTLATPRGDLGALPLPPTLALMGVLGSVAAVATARLLRPLHRPPPRAASDRLLLALAALAPVAAALWSAQGHDGAAAGEGLTFLRRCAGCAAFGGALAVPVLVLATVLRRARVDGPAVAALAGVVAGIAATLVLHVHCPITAAAHVLVGHVALVPALALAATLWRRRT